MAADTPADGIVWSKPIEEFDEDFMVLRQIKGVVSQRDFIAMAKQDVLLRDMQPLPAGFRREKVSFARDVANRRVSIEIVDREIKPYGQAERKAASTP